MSGEGDNTGGNSGGQGGAGSAGASGAAGGITEERVNEIVNVTVGKRLRDFESKQTKTLDKLQDTIISKVGESLGATLDEKLGDVLGSKLEEIGIKPAGTTAKGGSVDEDAIKNSPFVKGLLKKLETQEAQTKKLQDERASERKAVRSEKLRAQLIKELTTAGLDPKRVGDAADLLLFRNRVRYESDESEGVVFSDSNGEEVDLKTGIGDWAKSEDGKLYSPPSGASGSGQSTERRTTATTSTNGAPDKSVLKSLLAKAYTGEIT